MMASLGRYLLRQSTAEYNSVNFCLSPGAPVSVQYVTRTLRMGMLLMDGSWEVARPFGNLPNATCPVATYWNGGRLTEKDDGLSAAGAGNLTSVFMVCNSPESGQLGCSGPFQSAGLTYAVGANAAGTQGLSATSMEIHSLGSWGCPFTSSAGNTKFNSVYMYVDQTGNLGRICGWRRWHHSATH